MTLPFLFSSALILPLAAGFVALIAGKASWSNAVTQAILIASGALGLAAVGLFYSAGLSSPLVLSGMLGAVFGVSSLSAFFLGLICLGIILTSFYSIGYLPHYRDTYALQPLNMTSALFIFGMMACVMSQSVFSFLLFWEVMSVAVYFLVIADGSAVSLKAGLLYFMMTHLGFVSILAGFMILTGGNPFVDFSDVPSIASGLTGSMRGIAFALLFIGFGSKAGLIPLHRWLPAAHPQAPSGSSALMSGVMIKIALFGFLQAMLLFPAIPLWYSVVVFVVGLVSAFFGVLYASVESDVKRFLAWSSIENMGLIFSGVGALGVILSLPNPLTALAPALLFFIVMHTLSHSIFKTGLFMGAGAVILGVHTRDMDEMGGLAREWPAFSAAFLALTLAASALPPFAAFYSEWAYLQGLAAAASALDPFAAFGAAVALSVVALVGGLAIFAFAKAFSAIFLGRGRGEPERHTAPMPLLLSIPVFASAVLSVAASFFAPFIASIIGTGSLGAVFQPLMAGASASIDPFAVALLVMLASALMLVLRGFVLNRSRVRVTGTWDCGQPLTRRMEYTATGFSAPMRFFFRGLVVSEKSLLVEPLVSGNPWIARRVLTWDVRSFWERWFYLPIGRGVFAAAHQVRRIQNGSIQFYLLLVFIALVGTIIVSL